MAGVVLLQEFLLRRLEIEGEVSLTPEDLSKLFDCHPVGEGANALTASHVNWSQLEFIVLCNRND